MAHKTGGIKTFSTKFEERGSEGRGCKSRADSARPHGTEVTEEKKTRTRPERKSRPPAFDSDSDHNLVLNERLDENRGNRSPSVYLHVSVTALLLLLSVSFGE